VTFDDHVERWGQHRAAIDDHLDWDSDTVDHRGVAATILDERAAAYMRAAHHGMDLTVESELSPTVLSGSFRGRRFWYYERRGTWELRLRDAGGPVIADSDSLALADVIDRICDRIARYDCLSVAGADRREWRRVPESPDDLHDARRHAVEAIEDEPWETWW